MTQNNLDEHQVIELVHQDYWPDELLSAQFEFLVEKILTRKQRQILELKVENQTHEGTITNNMVAQILQIKEVTVVRRIREIKYKLRNWMELRVDNLNPAWMYTQRRKYNEKKEKEI